MQQPSIGRIVVYTDNGGTRYAAIISRDPQPQDAPDGRVLLYVFGNVLSGDHLLSVTQGEGKGHWSWPEHHGPKDVVNGAPVGLGAGVGVEGHEFGFALDALRSGGRVARRGWNGRGMFLFYMPGYPEGVPCNANTAQAMKIEQGTTVVVLPYLAMRTVDGSIVPWLASQTDILGRDWVVVE